MTKIPEKKLNQTRNWRKYFYLDYGEKLYMFDQIQKHITENSVLTAKQMVDYYQAFDEDEDILPYWKQIKLKMAKERLDKLFKSSFKEDE